MTDQLDEKIAALKEQNQKLQSQKDQLLRELNEVEDKFESQNLLYRRYFPIILDIVAKGDTAFAKACSELKNALKKRPPSPSLPIFLTS